MVYFISNNGVQRGPLTFDQLKGQEINGETLVWKEGTSDWGKASDVEELVPILELMPPPVDVVQTATAQTVSSNAKGAKEQDPAQKVLDDALKEEERNTAVTKDTAEVRCRMPEVEEKKAKREVVDNTIMFSHFLTFRGRSRCAEYWIVHLVDKRLSMIIDLNDLTVWMVLLIVFDLYVVLSTGVRRCHDRGHSGFYILIPFYAFYLLFAGSMPGDNKYGNNPKGENFEKLY